MLKYKNWHYKNTALLICGLVILFLIADTDYVKSILVSIGQLGYLGAFITGIFFVSIFTVAPASVVLFYLATQHDPILLSMLAGLGAVLGDYVIFRFLKDRVFEELHYLFKKMGGSKLSRLFNTPYFAWALPILGAAIIASPFPDEIGISLLGLSRVKNWQFVVVTYLLNTIGIFIIITASEWV